MKTVIVGGSKLLIGIVIVVTVLAAALMLWFKFGIRPFDRLNARVQALSKTDPDQALALYPQVIAEADKAHISVEDRSKIYLQLGILLQSYGKYQLAIDNLTKSVELSRKSWRGITEANAILYVAECRMRLAETKKLTSADLDNLTVAATIHPAIESGTDKWFWPAYEQALGRMHACIGDYSKALEHGQKSVDEYKAEKATAYAGVSQALLIDVLIRQGKYIEANKKFIESVDDPAFGGYQLRGGFRQSLRRAQDRDPGFNQRVLAMLSQKQFAELDKLGADMQASKKVLPSGRWCINDLYTALDSRGDAILDSDWRKHIELLKQWVKTRPDSATAKIALGKVLVSYAWQARGSGYSDSVTKEGWNKFGERLAQAKAVLDQVKDKPAEWYSATQTCALGQSWEADRYNAMVAECQKHYPDYNSVVFMKSYWLQPRWNGREGEYESYIASEANKRPGTPGDILYARSAWNLDTTIDGVMNQTKLSWPRVKSGLLQVIKQYPDSLLAKGMLSMLAMEVKDKQTAEGAFGTENKGNRPSIIHGR